MARAGFFLRLRGVLGVAAWPAEAVTRPAGAAVATPRAPSSLSSAAVAAAGEALVRRAGSVTRIRGVLGVAAWPAKAEARPARPRSQPLARPPHSPLLLWRPPARRPWPVRGPSPSFAVCWGSGRGRPRRWRGPPGPRLQPLARPPRSPLRLRQPSAMRPVPALGLPPCRQRAGGRGRGRGVACWGCSLRFLRVWGPLLGRCSRACCLGGRGRSARLAQAPGLAAAACPAPPPPPASAPRAPRGSPLSTPGTRGSGSGTGGGGGRPAGGSHRILRSLLSW